MTERDELPAPADEEPELPPAPPSRGRDQAIWVGFFLVLGIIAIFAALFILTDAAFFRGRYIVSTVVTDAGGIRRGDPVQMLGVNIGRVQRFRIAKDNVEIRLELEGEYNVPKDSHVELKSGGLLGGMIADVVPGDATEYLRQRRPHRGAHGARPLRRRQPDFRPAREGHGAGGEAVHGQLRQEHQRHRRQRERGHPGHAAPDRRRLHGGGRAAQAARRPGSQPPEVGRGSRARDHRPRARPRPEAPGHPGRAHGHGDGVPAAVLAVGGDGDGAGGARARAASAS